MLKKLDRYILKEFFSPLFLIIFGFANLVMLVQIVDTLPGFRDWNPPFRLILAYHFCKFPLLAAQVTPVAVMLSSLIALGNLARQGEIAAMRSGGISAARIAKPILWAAFFICLALLALSELLVPYATDQARYIQKVLIEHRSLNWGNGYWREKLALNMSGGRQFFIDRYDGQKAEMGGVLILEKSNGMLCSRIDAAGGHYQNGNWILNNGVERTFGPDGTEIAVTPFEQKALYLQEKPEDLLVNSDQREEDLLQLSARELASIVRVLKNTGSDYHKELVCEHVRISYPFSCFVLALLGVSLPFLFPYGKRAMVGAAIGIVIALGTGMLYLVFIQVGLSLGKSGVLPSILAAWIGNLSFLGLGWYALRKVEH